MCVCIYEIAHNRAIWPCHPSHSMPLALILPRGDQWYLCVCVYLLNWTSPCVCVCCHPIYSGRQACGRTSRGHTGFLRLPSVVLALIFIARRIQPSLSLVDRKVESCVPTNYSFSLLVGHFIFFTFFVRNNPSSCDCLEIQTYVPTSKGFEVTK